MTIAPKLFSGLSTAFAAAAIAAVLAIASPAAALEPSGEAIRVDPRVDAAGPGGQRLIELQGAVFMGDEIVSGPNGLAQIRFLDNTRIIVGPNSRLRIDTFVFNPDYTARDITMTAVRGTFRFISGDSAPNVYKIRTPTMTIGIRG